MISLLYPCICFDPDNPFYDIEKIVTEDASKVRFIYKLELEYDY